MVEVVVDVVVADVGAAEEAVDLDLALPSPGAEAEEEAEAVAPAMPKVFPMIGSFFVHCV